MINSKEAKTMILKKHKKYIKDFKNTQLRPEHKVLLTAYMNALKDKLYIPSRANIKKLKGEWQGYRSLELSFNIRVIFRYCGEQLELVRIGTHNQLYKYK